MNRALCSSAILGFVKPWTAGYKCTKVDVYFCCSPAFGQSKLKMSSEQEADAALDQPLLSKATCWE